MAETTQTVRPFSCGTQYGDWTDRNCGNCRKAADINNPPARCPCDIEQALLEAYFSDGRISLEIAQRMGFEGPTARYCWPCPEREAKEAAP